MGSFCDFCGGQRSMVYCRSDAASLCLSCDRSVHSANALSRRHSRTLLCDRCYSQPATVRYIEECISLCQNCDWNEHGNSTSSSGHKKQTISCYSGCPSATELARIWPFVLQFSSITNSSCDQGIKGLMSINENCTSTCWKSLQQSSTADMADICSINDAKKLNTTNLHITSSAYTASLMIGSTDQPANSTDSSTPKSSDDRMKKVGNSEDDFYDGFTEDDEFTFENYEVLFGASQAHSESIFDDVGIDSIFEIKENSSANTNCQGELVTEASSAGLIKSMQIAISNALSDSVMPNQAAKADYSMSISASQAHSSLSRTFSSLTGESSAGDHQDCGLSSMLCIGEQPPWCPTSSDISIQATNRDNAVMRYKEKKKARKFEKKIRYASRKTRADSRRRVKGRFVKAGEAFDYDPLCQA